MENNREGIEIKFNGNKFSLGFIIIQIAFLLWFIIGIIRMFYTKETGSVNDIIFVWLILTLIIT